MTIAAALLAWLAISVVIALVVGRCIHWGEE